MGFQPKLIFDFPEMSTSDNDDHLELSVHAQAALKSFLLEQEELQSKFAALQAESESAFASAQISMDIFTEGLISLTPVLIFTFTFLISIRLEPEPILVQPRHV